MNFLIRTLRDALITIDEGKKEYYANATALSLCKKFLAVYLIENQAESDVCKRFFKDALNLLHFSNFIHVTDEQHVYCTSRTIEMRE